MKLWVKLGENKLTASSISPWQMARTASIESYLVVLLDCNGSEKTPLLIREG